MGGAPTDTVHSSQDVHTQMLSQSQVPAVSSADNLPTQNVHDTGIHEHIRRPLLISMVAPLGGLRPHPYKRTVSTLPTHPAGNDVPEALQIAVMIVMPSPNTHNCSASQPLHSWNEKTWPGQNALQPRDEPQRVPSVEKQDSIMQEVKEDGSAIRLEVSEDVQEVSRNADEDHHGLLPEYQIGVATIPWYVDLDSRPPSRLLHPTS
ncbi:hypothetical protein CPC08DRAFT_703416 [Agrocybe pediades]|nr:hypothetical protein CPC08DRAFT_703416 [Agrocybe pediades]